MDWLSREKEGNSTSPLTGSVDHRCVLQSNTGRLGRESAKKARMKRPSADHLGDHMPDEPGTTVTCPLPRSRMRRSSLRVEETPRANKTFFPSGDQFASSISAPSPGKSLCGFPP